MARVEKDDLSQQKREAEERQRQPVDRTPGKAEGEEGTVDEALRHQEEERSS